MAAPVLTRPVIAPTRGIIIVDSSAILPMCAELKNEHLTEEARKKEKPVRLADTLNFLAKHGYEVIIPEMAAIECGGFMRDGTSTEDHSVHKNAYSRLCRPFLGGIPDQHGNIRIEPPSAKDSTQVATYVRALWKVHKKAHERADNTNPAILKVNEMNRTTHQAFDRSNFGDMAAFELIRHMKKPSVPVFYLSCDNEARAKAAAVRPDIQVNGLGPSGLFHALKKRSTLSEIGIANVGSEEVLQHCISVLNGMGFEQKASLNSLRYPLDRGAEPDQRPFYDSLRGLREEITSESKEYKLTKKEVAEAAPSNAIDKFRKKYAPRPSPLTGEPPAKPDSTPHR